MKRKKEASFISLGKITSFTWVMKLNVYETIQQNYALRMDVSSMFHFRLCDVTVFKTTPWNFPLRNILFNVYGTCMPALTTLYSSSRDKDSRNHLSCGPTLRSEQRTLHFCRVPHSATWSIPPCLALQGSLCKHEMQHSTISQTRLFGHTNLS